MRRSTTMIERVASRWNGFARYAAVVLGLTASSAFVGCNSDDDDSDEPEGDPADCRLIANRCHPYDDGSNVAHECHEVGHEGSSPAACTKMRAECLDACPPREPDAGTGGAGGSSGSSAGGTSPSGGSAGSSGGSAGTGGAAGEPSGGSSGAAGSGTTGGTSNGGAGSGGASPGGTRGRAGKGGAGAGSRAGSGGAGGAGGSGGTGETACETLGRVCHDAGSGLPEECHELGHDGNEPACEARLAECLAACM